MRKEPNIKLENTRFNERQKIAALAMRFYHGAKWEPRVGDYYCLTREQCELYQIVRSDGENFYIRVVLPSNSGELQDGWPIAEFQLGFGVNRVFVPPFIFEKADAYRPLPKPYTEDK